MKWEIYIDGEQGLTYVRCSGTYHPDDYINILEDMAAHPDFTAGMKIIIDYRGVDGSKFGFDSVMKLARRADKYDAILGGGYSAAIVDSDVGYGLIRMYLQSVNWVKTVGGVKSGRKRMVFNSPEKAKAFVHLPLSYAFPIPPKSLSA